MQCERGGNDRAAGWVMRVERGAQVGQLGHSHDTQHMPGQAGAGLAADHWNAIPRFQLNFWQITPHNCLSLFLWSHRIR